MKIKDLRPCDCCQGAITGPRKSPVFVRIRFERLALKADPINRHLGLALFFGSNHQLADAMGAQEEITDRLGDEVEIYLCDDCAMGMHLEGGHRCAHVLELASLVEDRQAKAAAPAPADGKSEG